MRMKNKKWSLPFINDHSDIIYREDTINELSNDSFFDYEELYLEIGTGKGGFISKMAEKNPNKRFLGIEKSVTCLAITAKKVEEAGLNNVRLILGDVNKLIDSLPNHRFKVIFLNFSDPWPKKRHFKRRLTYDTLLKRYSDILIDDGRIIMKTDNVELFDFSQEKLQNNGFEITYLTYQYDGTDEFDVMTEYEEYFRNEGTKINRLIAKKVKDNEVKCSPKETI